AVWGTAARQGAVAAEAAGRAPVLWAPGSEVRADPVDVAGVARLPAKGVLARPGLARDDVAILLGIRPSRVGRAVADPAARRPASGQRRHIRRVLRALH